MGMSTEVQKSIKIQQQIQKNKEERLKDYFDKNGEDQYIAYVKERIIHTIIISEKLKDISVTSIPFPHIGLYFDMGTEKISQTIKKTQNYFIGNNIEVEIVDNFPNPKHVEYKVEI